jgi:ribosomal protein S12
MFRKPRALALHLPVVAGAVAFALIAGCGGGANEKVIDDAQKRIEALKSKGVPLDKLTEARVFLDEAKTAREKKNNSAAKKAIDSSLSYLVKAEAFYQQEVANLGPKIDANKSAAIKAKEELSGYQVKKVDSIVGVVDSLRRIDWLLQSYNVSQELVKLVPFLKEDENKVRKIMNKIPGEWVYTEKAKSVEFPIVNAVMTRSFKFGDLKSRSVYLQEKKVGYSGGYLHEDWEFQSWGKYDFRGDTVMLEINRFKIAKQMFKRLHKIDGKDVWTEEPQPTYDSAITDGSQDRSITYEDLTVDFKKR